MWENRFPRFHVSTFPREVNLNNDEGEIDMRTLLTICGLSLLACWPFPGDAQEESLVLYFSFDKEVADEIKDLSGHQNNGKISGKPKKIDLDFSTIYRSTILSRFEGVSSFFDVFFILT